MKQLVWNRRKAEARSGFTLVEMMIGSTILLLLAGSVWETLNGMKQITIVGTVDTHLQKQVEKAMTAISTDLRTSGRVDEAGIVFPYSFGGGIPDEDHDPEDWHTHQLASKTGDSDKDEDAQQDRDIILLLPQDSDANGVPDVDPLDGELIWDTNTISYSVRTQADGVNVLTRKQGAGSPVVVARNVERAVFEVFGDAGAGLLVDQVRVTLYFKDFDQDGRAYRQRLTSIFRMRNGEQL